MIDGEELFLKFNFISNKLSEVIKQDKGLRIGQSTVLSKKMHTFDPMKPQEVNILCNLDAGQVFYNKRVPGQIYHMDIFHQCGIVDHIKAANEIQKTIEVYNYYYCNRHNITADALKLVQADLIDIQTASGGGRITGSLEYGQKKSLRNAHSNHVHVAFSMPSEHLNCIFYIIMAVEGSILASKLELRCNETIFNIESSATSNLDLSAYTDSSDSLLREDNLRNNCKVHQTDVSQFDDVIEKNDTAEELYNFTHNFDNKRTTSSKPTSGINSRRVTEGLTKKGIIELNDKKLKVVKNNTADNEYLEIYMPEIEAHLRDVIRKAKYNKNQAGGLANQKIYSNGSYLSHKLNLEEQLTGDIAISETVMTVFKRMVKEDEPAFYITQDDLQYFTKNKRKKINFCLLIDASSSMEGQRIKAAKNLARYLLFSTPDKVSVIVFQENKAWVQVPFTRDYQQIENSLKDINACGETPLALGMTACLKYITEAKVLNPLIILITDGVPTLSTISGDPVYDAMEVAKKIKEKNYGFTCIGLKPHLEYLKKLSKVAGGSVYAVDKL